MEQKPDLSYFAGFFDGEGCVQGYKASSYDPNRKLGQVRVVIRCTNETVLIKFKERFGGNILSLKRKKSNWSPAWQWTLGTRAATNFLKEVLPFLLIKREEASLVAIELGDLAKPKQGSTRVSESTIEKRLELVHLLHVLKPRNNGYWPRPA